MRVLASALLVFTAFASHTADLVRKSCGFDPLLHRVHHADHAATDHVAAAGGRSVNSTGTTFAKWVNEAGVFPNPVDQKTIVTYSIVTTTENYAGETLTPFDNAEFIGANTITVIREGLESWNDVAGITLQFVQSKGQIRIGAGVLSGGVVGLGGYGAASRNGGQFYMTEGFVQLDRTDGAWDAPTLRAVAAHEMGHALGLNHTSDNTALMAPKVNSSTGPLADDRWYMQFLYGSAPAKLNASAFQGAPVTLNIGRAAPKQTGTNTDPLFEDGFDVGVGTGTKTQSDVARYVVERKGANDADFTVLDANVLAPTTQNADGALNHGQNAFTFSDATVASTGLYTYRVKAVHASGDDIYSATVAVSVGGSGGDSNPENTDSDGDGFPDAVELAANTSATDANATPFGGVPATNSQALTVTKASIGLNFKTTLRDTFSLAGTIPATDVFLVEGQTAIVDFGGLVRVFTLASNGTGVDRDAKAKVGPKVSKGVLKFAFSGSKGSFQDSFDDELLTNRDTVTTGENVTVLATVYLMSAKYMAPLTLIYKAKAGKSGKGTKAKI